MRPLTLRIFYAVQDGLPHWLVTVGALVLLAIMERLTR